MNTKQLTSVTAKYEPFNLLLIGKAVLIFLLLSSWLMLPSCQTKSTGPVLTSNIKKTFVRGYVTVSVKNRKSDGVLAAQRLTSVYIPNVKVYLENTVNKELTKVVKTDLSGRFEIYDVKPGIYRMCWKAYASFSRCEKKNITVSGKPVHMGDIAATFKLPTNQKAIYGSVLLGDNSIPRRLEPLLDINAFATVHLVNKAKKKFATAYVNNSGHYYIPIAPARLDYTIVASIEKEITRIDIRPATYFNSEKNQRVDIKFKNRPPIVTSVTPFQNGKRVRIVAANSTVDLKTIARDSEGHVLTYQWFLSKGSGLLSDATISSPTWNLPKIQGRYIAKLTTSDKHGGYTQYAVGVTVDAKGIVFAGKVKGSNAAFVANAEVEINGEKTTTNAQGHFRTYVKPDERYVFNIRKPGYGFYSKIYPDGVTGGRWTLTRASVSSVDPTKPIKVKNIRTPQDCSGRVSDRVDWKKYPRRAIPQFQNGEGRIINRPKDWRKYMPNYRGKNYSKKDYCGPGIRVSIPANSIVDEKGIAPTGNVDVSLTTIDLMSGEQMPGDYTVVVGGNTRVMESYGAGQIEITDGSNSYNLKPGATAEVRIPVDPAQLAAAGRIPTTIPIIYYDRQNGVWKKEGNATLQGIEYVAIVKHFSDINADLIKTNQSCVRIKSPSLPSTYKIEMTVPQGNSAPRLYYDTFDNTDDTHVVYNLPSDKNIILVPYSQDDVPYGTFVVNTGGPQNPTDPNKPVYPYDACSTEVILTNIGVPAPPPDAFLHGMYSFNATNLTELEGVASEALKQATLDYYDQIDPRGKRDTLSKFIATNNFNQATEITAAFANSGDLGFGREMHCTSDVADDNNTDVACYVSNYGFGFDTNGDPATPDEEDADAAAQALVDGSGPLIATVAMEYSRIESTIGKPVEFDDPQRVVKFYVFNAAGDPINSADLDGEGARPIPQLCMVCHGGAYPGGINSGTPSFNSRNDVKLGSFFLPFDLHFFTFPPNVAGFDKASQQPNIKRLNEDIVLQAGPNPAIIEVISEMYASGPNQDETFTVPGWNTDGSRRAMYDNVISKACRSCHITHPAEALRFQNATDAIDILGTIEKLVCEQFKMPHAKTTFEIFWNSTVPHMPSQLQAFGDVHGSDDNGWQANVCAEVIAGGDTPTSFYTDNIQPIWNSNCTFSFCHDASAPAAGMDLTASVSHGQIVNIPSSQLPSMARIEPNNPNNSYLRHKLHDSQSSVGGAGTQMPPRNGQLSPTDLLLIDTWITDHNAAP
ncbi:MAG: hypothetical protein ACC707_07105 [Thiohalomonadales bacterium]